MKNILKTLQSLTFVATVCFFHMYFQEEMKLIDTDVTSQDGP